MLADLIETYLIPIALHILAAVVVWIVGRWLARNSRRWLVASLQRTALTPSLITLLDTVVYYGLLILTAAVALAALGVPISAIVPVLSIVIVVLAIALQASLSNLAATIIFLLFKPFKVGDLIETEGMVGLVQEIQILSTVLASADGKTHIIPNGKIQGTRLTNYTTSGVLRIDLKFRIGYDSDLDKAKAILSQVLAAESRILSQPPTTIFVQNLADNGVDLVAWPFTTVEHYGPLQTCLVEQVKAEFHAAGIAIPYPQQGVHLYTHN